MSKSRSRRYIRHGMLPQLAVFEAVSRLGSYTRAAEELFIAQPTVSTQMKKLADTLGVPLVEQSGKRLEITEAGRELGSACADIFARLERLEERLLTLRNTEQGRLRVAGSSAAKHFLPRLLDVHFEPGTMPSYDPRAPVPGRRRQSAASGRSFGSSVWEGSTRTADRGCWRSTPSPASPPTA